MAKVKRNGPCPCGSGNKAKRCCYGNEQLFDNELVPKELCAEVISDLAGTSTLEMRSLFDQLFYLPELDLSLQVPLPLIRTPHLDRAIRALQDDKDDVFDQELAHVVPLVDDADHRSTLASPCTARQRACSKEARCAGGARTRAIERLRPFSFLRSLNRSPSWRAISARRPACSWRPDRGRYFPQPTSGVRLMARALSPKGPLSVI
jgi:hypothetical protein